MGKIMIPWRRHVSYFKYIMRHKWYVFVATRQTRCSLWRGLVHDLSKFRPSEWFPYANTFYDDLGGKRYSETDDFNMAWLHHQRRNLHHWQYWILKMDRGEEKRLKMPEKYVREMIADWMGAGRAITGKWEVYEWYQKNKDTIKLHPDTREMVDSMLSILKFYGT